MKEEQFYFFFDFLQQEEIVHKEKNEKLVMIEKAINLKLLCDYVVSCSYGDIVLIICMLHDYVRMLDEQRSDIQYKAYYRNKFITMADRLAEQIEYDYEKAVEKCKKKQEKNNKHKDDVGEDAMVLAVKKGIPMKKKEGDKNDMSEVKKGETETSGSLQKR